MKQEKNGSGKVRSSKKIRIPGQELIVIKKKNEKSGCPKVRILFVFVSLGQYPADRLRGNYNLTAREMKK